MRRWGAAARGAVVVCALAACWPAAAAAAVSGVRAPIDRVTVYPGGVAEIERVAETKLSAGRHEIVFDGLAAEVVEGSLRAEIEQGASIRLGAVALRREPVADANRERESELRARLAQLEAERASAQDRIEVARTRLDFIEGLAALPRQEGAHEALGGAGAEERWPALWRTIGEGAAAARDDMRVARRESERLGKEIETVERRLEQLGRGQRERVEASVTVEAAASAAVALRLRYRIRGPQWAPVYEARLDTGAGTVRLVRRARVRQASGTDWRDVELAFATARPVRGPLPDLQPWWIDLRPSPAAGAAAESVLRADGAAPRAAVTGTPFATFYRVAGRVTVPGSNEPREIRIDEQALGAEVGARVVPQRADRAWLVARLAWTGDETLPAGELARFRDGAFVGTTRLTDWAPGEDRTVGFGVDPAIRVDFRRLKDQTGESGILSKRATHTRHYRLTLSNGHAAALPVEVRFRVPVARAEAIDVEPWLPDAPDIEDLEDRRGVFAWQLELDAGGEHALRMGYRVSYPSDERVPGF